MGSRGYHGGESGRRTDEQSQTLVQPMTASPIGGDEVTDAEWRSLIAAARKASANAFSRYSGFSVGAAVLTGERAIASGCNVENASFGLTICAERTAVFRAVADGARTVVAVALYTPTPDPAAPCGACRQVIAEFGPRAIIRCCCDGPAVETFTLDALLPHAFSLPPDR
jgi:cytidine deaminase